MNELNGITAFIKYNREKLNLSQEQLAEMSGVGIHLIRDLEQGKSLKSLDKVNGILALFGYQLTPMPKTHDAFQIWLNYFNKAVKITKKNKQTVYGFLIKELRDETGNIVAWKLVQNPNAIQWQKTKDDKLTIEIRQSEIEEISLQTT